MVVRIDMQPGVLIRGTVVDVRGKPVEGASVVLRELGTAEGLGERHRRTDHEGFFRFEGLPDARFVLFASRQRKGKTESGKLHDIAPGMGPVRLQIRPEESKPGK